MLHGLYYITARRSAVKRFTGITTQYIDLLDMLVRQNGQCHYKRLRDLLRENGYCVADKVFSDLLKGSIDRGYVTRLPIAGNVFYCITSEGRALLYAFAAELDRLVSERIKLIGNGFNLE